ncbi:ZFP62 [Branchiostoma lanceolatum]|uniref:ZFP62 protein n=1 Tax=Branchiostoma lanceolatum TaxID=7740 RepID=A0A8J9YTS0_BRALA|nr:ZFP62 [Branchiostoma lanceolatum]
MSRRKQQNPTRLAEREGGEMGPSTEEGRHNATPGNGSLATQNPTQQHLQDSQNPALQNSFLQHITDIQKLQEQTQSLLNNAQKTQNILDTQASQMFKIGVPVDPSHNHMHQYARPGPSSPPVRNNTTASLLTSPLAQSPFPGNIGFMPMPLSMMGLPLRPGVPIPPMLSPLFGHPGLLPAVVGKSPVETPPVSQSATRQTTMPGGGGAPHVMTGLQEGLTLEQLKVIQDIVSKFPKEKSVGPRIVAPSPELVQAWQNALQTSSQSTSSPTGQESGKDGKSTTAHTAEQIIKWQKMSQLQRTDEEHPSGGGVSEGGNGTRDKIPAAYLSQQGMSLIHNGSSSAESAFVNDAGDVETSMANDTSADMELHTTIAKGRDVFSAPKPCSNFIRAERVGSLGYWTPGRPRRGRTFHTCHICGKVFRRPSEVQRHLRVHTGEQPFQCDLCYRRFNDKSNWRNHMIRVHRIESPVWPSWSQEGTPRDETFQQRSSDNGENGELSDESPNLETNSQVNSDDIPSNLAPSAEPMEEMSGEDESRAMIEQEGLDLSTSVKNELPSPQVHVKEEEEMLSTDVIDNGLEKGLDFPPTEEISSKVEETAKDKDGNSQDEQGVSQEEMMRENAITEEYSSGMVDSEGGTTLQVKQEPPSPEGMTTASQQQEMTATSEQQFLFEQAEDQGSQDSFEDTTDSEKKIYHCETCQKPFSRVDSLRRHRILHTGVKPHGCPFCPYRTYYKGNLNVHMERAHSAELQDIKQREMFNFGTLAGNQAVSPSSQFVSDLNVSDSMVELPTSNTGIYSNPVLSNQMYGIHSNQLVTNDGRGLPNMEDIEDEEDDIEEEAMEEESLPTTSLQMDPGASNISQSCNVCGETFDPDNLTAEMVHHAAMHQTNKVSHDVFYSCNMCKAKFRSREGLENHKEQIHQSEVYGRMITKVSESYLSYTHTTGNATGKIVTKYFHRCNLCGKKFDRPSGALRHTRVHTGEKPFTCRICGMPFQDKSGLKAHTLRKHPEVVFNTAPGSELSPENYKTLSHINSQLNNLHSPGDTDFAMNDEEQAQEASEQQGSQDSLQPSSSSSATLTQEMGTAEKESVVDIQDDSPHQLDPNLSRENTQVEKHTVTKNGPIRKTSDTAYWPKRKKGAKKLARVAAVLLNGAPREGIPKGSIPVFRKGRLSLVRADDLKPNACTICGKRFWYKYDLRRHMTMHSDFRPHKCKFCKYRSRQLNQLKIHMQRHKGVFRPFHCPACDFSASTKPEMKAHVARHLTIWTNHICPFCYYGFREPQHSWA